MSYGDGLQLPPTDASLNCLSQEYSYQDVFDATEGFSSSSRLGQGTYGSVYQGTLRDGTEVAVKVLSKPNEAGFREEVEVLSKFRHPNLVILMGFARNSKERYLVYELLPGGDVCARLQKDSSFVWRPRLNVALDSALGLSHLHCARPQIFHRDIKTQNILMDRNGTGKMADFGLALLAQPNCESLTVEHTSGTIGYADPLYIRSGVVTERSEVYSFGMVLLELLTGRPPALQHVSGRIEYQFAHIDGELSRVQAMLDPRARWPATLAVASGQLALRCVHNQETMRPSFVEIVKELRHLLRSHPEQSTGVLLNSSTGPPPQVEQKAAQRNGPFLGAQQTPAWAACAQRQRGIVQQERQESAQRQTGVVQQERPERQEREAPVGVNANLYSPLFHSAPRGEGAMPDAVDPNSVGVRVQRGGTNTGGVQRIEPQEWPDTRRANEASGRSHLIGSRVSGEPSSSPTNRYANDPLNAFSKIGASLYASADPSADSESSIFQSGTSSGYGRRAPPSGLQGNSANTQLDATQLVRPINPQRIVQVGEPLCMGSRSFEQRQPQQTSSSRNEQRVPFSQGHHSRLLQVVSSVDELVDESPPQVVDCGAPEEPTPDRWNEPPREAVGGKPFLLPFAFPSTGAGNIFSQQGVSDLLGLAPTNGATGSERTPGTNKEIVNEEMCQRLQDEMGFSRYQVTEAFKRCSTAEAAIDWILSPERQWADNWHS